MDCIPLAQDIDVVGSSEHRKFPSTRKSWSLKRISWSLLALGDSGLGKTSVRFHLLPS